MLIAVKDILCVHSILNVDSSRKTSNEVSIFPRYIQEQPFDTHGVTHLNMGYIDWTIGCNISLHYVCLRTITL